MTTEASARRCDRCQVDVRLWYPDGRDHPVIVEGAMAVAHAEGGDDNVAHMRADMPLAIVPCSALVRPGTRRDSSPTPGEGVEP